MILTKDEVKNFDKAMILDSNYKFDEFTFKAVIQYDVLYEGKDINDENKEQIAINHRNETKDNLCDLFHLGINGDHYSSNKYNGRFVNNKNQRKNFIIDLYKFAVTAKIPVFIKFDDDYFYVNRLLYKELNKETLKEEIRSELNEMESFMFENKFKEKLEKYKIHIKELQAFREFMGNQIKIRHRT